MEWARRQSERRAEGGDIFAANAAARRDGDRFALAEHPCGVKRVEVQERRGQSWGERLSLGDRILTGKLGDGRLHGQRDGHRRRCHYAVERNKSLDQRFQRGGHGRIVRHHGALASRSIRDANRRMKSRFDLGNGSRELDPSSAGGQRGDVEALHARPPGHRGHVFRRIGISIREGLRCKPMAILGRGGILLCFELVRQRLAPRGRGLKQEDHALQTRCRRRRAKPGDLPGWSLRGSRTESGQTEAGQEENSEHQAAAFLWHVPH